MNDTDQDVRLQRPLTELELTKRALRACEVLGLRTLGDALACAPERFVGVPGCGEKTYQAFIATVHAAAETGSAAPQGDLVALLPDDFLDISLARFFLPDSVRSVLAGLAVGTLRDLLAAPPAVRDAMGPGGAEAVRTELGRLMRLGTERFDTESGKGGHAFRGLAARLLACCDDQERTLLERRIGLGCRAESRWQLAAKWRVAEGDLAAREQELVDRLHARFGAVLAQLRAEVESELAVSDGVLTGDGLVPGTLLYSAVEAHGDHALPLRLAAVLFPDEFHHHGTFLSTMPRAEFDALLGCLRRATRRALLPRPLDDVLRTLKKRGYAVGRELVAHVARAHLQRAVEIDGELGEVLTVRASTVAQRLQGLLEDHDEPMPLDTLQFDYRGRYRRCHRNTLRAQMRLDGRFLEVARDVWSLRERHLDELELARVEAERVVTLICTIGGRQRLEDLAEGEGYGERQRYLIADFLSHDPLVRDLGRHEFCSRFQEHSTVLAELLVAMHRAMGEIPVSRYLENQPLRRRGLVAKLLRRNRLFLSPERDRADLLTNYPFDPERVRRVIATVDQCLEEYGGYATLAKLRAALDTAQLGGEFLTEHLLADLLARHGRYETLAGGLVALQSLKLTGWIQQRAREAIRRCGHPLSADELLVERPELAEFGHCLGELLARDPLLRSPDGQRFQLT